MGYDGKLNKDRVTKEYYQRVQRIRSSELNARNKAIAHNCFAIPVFIPTIRILDWDLSEIEAVDIRRQKILCMTGNFQQNSDKNRLYVKRADGGRALKNFEESYFARIVSLKRHIVRNQDKNEFFENVYHHEEKRVMDEEESDQNEDTGNVIAKIKERKLKKNREEWLKKPKHGYLCNNTRENQEIDQTTSYQWIKAGKFSSHVKGFLFAIQEQEINTPALRRMRERDGERRAGMPIMCRLCSKQEESVFHIIAAHSYIILHLYLHARHNLVAKELYDELVPQLRQNENRSESKHEPQTVTRIENTEIWWDEKVMTQKKIKHDRPDIIIWDKENKHCKIVDVSVPLNTNVKLREQIKQDYYIELSCKESTQHTNML